MAIGNNTKIAIAVLLAGAGGWYFLGGQKGAKDNAPPAVVVSVAPAASRDVQLTVREVGNVVAYETVAVRSRLDSQVMEVKFKDGDYVEKGALLFVLDDRSLKAQEKELTANLQRDRAQLENLRLQFERAESLTKKGFVSAANLDNARAGYRAQQAAVGATQATLDNVRVQLGYTRILAPISGRTGTINVTTGNNVKANDTQALVTINQIKPIRVKMSLSQRYFSDVREAMRAGDVTVSAQAENSHTSSQGKLEYIDNEVDQASGTFVVRSMFANEDEALWPGMFVTNSIALGTQKNALTIPEVAVQHGQAGDYVFVIDTNKAIKRDIKVSRMQDNWAVIADGLNEGEQVAVDGLMSLKDGANVSVKTDATHE